MRSCVLASALVAAVALSSVTAGAQDRYLLLATTRTSTMEKEVNDAAERGYRVVAASRTESAEEIVAMERTRETYRYRVLATTRTGTLERELNDAAEAGYRAVPLAVGTKRTIGDVAQRNNRTRRGSNTEGELFVLMEKGPEVTPGLSYKVVATRLTGTLQKEMSESADAGYSLIALISRTEHLAIFERSDGER